jgi:hypothetical protein
MEEDMIMYTLFIVSANGNRADTVSHTFTVFMPLNVHLYTVFVLSLQLRLLGWPQGTRPDTRGQLLYMSAFVVNLGLRNCTSTFSMPHLNHAPFLLYHLAYYPGSHQLREYT